MTDKRRSDGLAISKRRFVRRVTIPVALYASIGIFSLAWAVALMFFEYSPGRAGGPFLGMGGSNPFIGLDHFRKMISSVSLEARQFRLSFKTTLIFAIAILPLNLLITLPLAVLIESVHDRLKGTFRAIYFLPIVTSSVGVALMWGYLYQPQTGLINLIIRSLGGAPVAWLTDPRAEFLGVSVALWAVMAAYIWADFGYNLIIFIAALQNMPKVYSEAATVDGAKPFQVFRYITIPLLRPTILFVAVFTMISSFQVFDIIQIMTRGGPRDQTRVLMFDVYENAFRFQRMGWATAIGFVLAGIVMIITIFQMRVLRTDWEF